MAAIPLITLAILMSVADGARLKERYLLFNPADLSTALGYQNHQVHDLTSLVDEVSGTAHGTGSGKTPSGQSPGAAYNVPNFPAMGQNQVLSQTGSLAGAFTGSVTGTAGQTGSGGTPFAVSNSGGSASFSGTNQWRCDAHVVESCDTQCMDIDPKDGCPFCISGCSSTSGGASSLKGHSSQSTGLSAGQGSAGNQSGSLSQNQGTLTSGSSQSGGLSQSPGLLSGGTGQSGSFGQSAGTLSGTAGQPGTGLGGGLIQQPSGLAGTGGNAQVIQSNQGPSVPVRTTSAACPHFPSNCPTVYTAVDNNGCLVCTILSKFSQTTVAPPVTSTLQTTSRTCAPKRCVAPCNIGIVLDANGCPQCLCPAHV